MAGILVIIGAAIVSLVLGLICGVFVGIATSYKANGEDWDGSMTRMWVTVVIATLVLFFILRAAGNHFFV